MQLASQGPRASTRAVKFLVNKPGGSNRSIHVASLRFPRAIPSQGAVQRLSTYSRNLFSRFFSILTTPGTLRSPSTSASRSLHLPRPTIQQRLSLPVRTSLSRPLHAPYLPRVPAVPRCTTQVGLGTARNFSSGRPIFQNLVENVPVAGRAFWEADWEIKMRQERENMKQNFTKSKGKKGVKKEMLKPTFQTSVLEFGQRETTSNGELDHYFPTATVAADVTTCLLIPLAPTPTSRAPLSSSPSHLPLLPLSALASVHADHTTHALRVSSLFARLDAAHVWERGVSCSAYSQGRGGGDGVCTVLKVEFSGWTAGEVRSIIGESGSGWCVLEEIRHNSGSSTPSDDISETASVISTTTSVVENRDMSDASGAEGELIDPSASLVLPTLDFSSSFLDQPQPPRLADVCVDKYDPDSDDDGYSDSGSDFSRVSDFSNESATWIALPSRSATMASGPGSTRFRFGFSSDFASRVGSEYEPRESVF